MVKFYLNQMEKSLMKLDDVPRYWKSKVETEIKKESEVNEEDGTGKLH